MFFSSLRRSHLFVAYIAVVSLLAEALTVSLANIPFRQGLTFLAFQINFGLTVGILGLMIVTFVILVLKRTTQFSGVTPPESLLQTMILLANSRWREDLYGMSTMSTRDRNQRVLQADRKYSLIQRWMKGSYGSTVDYAEE
jgi:hypothetical protein